jgi:hypothetical protein
LQGDSRLLSVAEMPDPREMEMIGLTKDDFSKEILRFLPLEYGKHLLTGRSYLPASGPEIENTFTLYLPQALTLRSYCKGDPEESRLLKSELDALALTATSKDGRDYLNQILTALQDGQARNVYVSCWHEANNPALLERMWEKYAGGDDGVAIVSTIGDLAGAPFPINETFLIGLGRVKYLQRDLGYSEAFFKRGGEYFSRPFLVKLSGEPDRHDRHEDDNEIRLYVRKSLHFHSKPDKPHVLLPYNPGRLIRHIKISPLCPISRRESVRQSLIDCFPTRAAKDRQWIADRILMPT